MRAPDNIFTRAKVNIPRIEYLPTYRSWVIGNNSELWHQDPPRSMLNSPATNRVEIFTHE